MKLQDEAADEATIQNEESNTCRGGVQPGSARSAPALGAARRLPKLLLILHTSIGFNNLGNLLFAQE
jgi:hypothetical protein